MIYNTKRWGFYGNAYYFLSDHINNITWRLLTWNPFVFFVSATTVILLKGALFPVTMCTIRKQIPIYVFGFQMLLFSCENE